MWLEISIAAFHAPASAMIAKVAGQRVGTGMSIFMATGELVSEASSRSHHSCLLPRPARSIMGVSRSSILDLVKPE